MAAPSPPAPSGRVLQTRYSLGNTIDIPQGSQKRVRTLSASGIPDSTQEQGAKRMKMEDKKAVSDL